MEEGVEDGEGFTHETMEIERGVGGNLYTKEGRRKKRDKEVDRVQAIRVS